MNARPDMPVSPPHRLASLFRPRSLVLVGATERSVWSNNAYRNLTTVGYAGEVHLVSRSRQTVYGQAAHVSCTAVGKPIDTAIVMVPHDALADAFDDLGRAGVASAVVLSSGFAETGADGASRQRDLRDAARRHGITLLGPNCLGFIDFNARCAAWTTRIVQPAGQPGNVAIVSQSGATAAYISYLAQQQGLSLASVISTGNEVDVSVAQVVDYLVDDPAIKVIVLFLEAVNDTIMLAAAATRALEAGKPIVALKVGTSPEAARAAQAHTGSLIGNDQVFDAACRQLGIIRVHALEDLVATAQLLAQWTPAPAADLALVSISGGVCEIAADHAHAAQVPLATLHRDTVDALRQVLPDFGTPNNPLDVTGAAMLDPALFERSLSILARDPDVGLVACAFEIVSDGDEVSPLARDSVIHIARGLHAGHAAGVLLSVTVKPVSTALRALLAEHGLIYVGMGLQHGLAAIAHARWWAGRRAADALRVADTAALFPPSDMTMRTPGAARPDTEYRTLAWLAEHGVPVIPMSLASSAAAASIAADHLDGPVALKIASADIAHKTEIGGVLLDVNGPAAVAAGYERILTAVGAAYPDARLDGVLVSPMRRGGIELFVGTLRDPQWGPAIVLGLGGVWVEVLNDTALRCLPIGPTDVLDMLDELRGARLLQGYRGGPAIDRDAVAAVVCAIGNAALALGPSLVSLEINPLWVAGTHIEALDALAVWDEPTGANA